ncbi:gp436 family protein [Megalodesulfovibrio paquesii]
MYCTAADLEERYGAAAVLLLADRDGDGLADAGVIERAITDAAAEVDGWVAARYTLPLASPSPVLARCACAIAWYLLAGNRAGGPYEQERKGYEDAVALLKAISKGDVRLGPEPDSQAPAPAGGAAIYAGPKPMWRRRL